MPVVLQPEVIVLLIGTNNLGAGMSPEDTLIGMKAVIDTIRSKRPLTHILLLGLLPRRGSFYSKVHHKPEQKRDLMKPWHEIREATGGSPA